MQENLPLQMSFFCRELQLRFALSGRVDEAYRERGEDDLETVGLGALRFKNCAMVFAFHYVRECSLFG